MAHTHHTPIGRAIAAPRTIPSEFLAAIGGIGQPEDPHVLSRAALEPVGGLVHASDSGHGWLLVTTGHLEAVGLSEDHLSPYSYVASDLIVACEEDCDAQIFRGALRLAGHDLGTLKERTYRDAPVRRWRNTRAALYTGAFTRIPGLPPITTTYIVSSGPTPDTVRVWHLLRGFVSVCAPEDAHDTIAAHRAATYERDTRPAAVYWYSRAAIVLVAHEDAATEARGGAL